MQYKPLDITKGEIRLLEILRDGQPDIQCKLINVPLDEAPPYDTISYVWGDPLDKKEILVNEQTLEVTSSCWRALVIHRHKAFKANNVYM